MSAMERLAAQQQWNNSLLKLSSSLQQQQGPLVYGHAAAAFPAAAAAAAALFSAGCIDLNSAGGGGTPNAAAQYAASLWPNLRSLQQVRKKIIMPKIDFFWASRLLGRRGRQNFESFSDQKGWARLKKIFIRYFRTSYFILDRNAFFWGGGGISKHARPSPRPWSWYLFCQVVNSIFQTIEFNLKQMFEHYENFFLLIN